MSNYCFNELWDSLDDEKKVIRVYLANEEIKDPYEETKIYTIKTPKSIKGIVTDLIATQINWKMPGVITTDAKELIIKKRYRSLIEASYKLEIDKKFYEGWKIQGNMQIREEGDFIRVYVYRRTSENV